jgi:hypothetical protein
MHVFIMFSQAERSSSAKAARNRVKKEWKWSVEMRFWDLLWPTFKRSASQIHINIYSTNSRHWYALK